MSEPAEVGISSCSLEQNIERNQCPSTLAPAQVSQYVVLIPKVFDFFIEQRRIGAQQPANPYPMKYDISVYRLADGTIEKCLARVDSADCRSRELSMRETEEAIDLLIEVLRNPLSEASVSAWTDPNRPPVEVLMKTHFVCKVPYSGVPDFRPTPQGIKHERNLFPTDRENSKVLVGVPYRQIQQICQKILALRNPKTKQTSGPGLYEETIRRIRNLIRNMFQPELACMKWFDESVIDKTNPVSSTLTAMIAGLANEVSWRLGKTDMSPSLVDTLIEPYIREKKSAKDIPPVLLEMVEKWVEGEIPPEANIQEVEKLKKKLRQEALISMKTWIDDNLSALPI